MTRWRAAALFTITVVLASACARTPRAGTATPAVVEAAIDPREWVGSLLPRLSLEDRVAQMIVVSAEVSFANVHASTARQTERLIDELHVGGLLVSQGTPIEMAARLNALQRRSPLPLLVAAEVDWGVARVLPDGWLAGARTAGATVLPVAMGLAATANPLAAELAGRVTAREARAVGINWLLAPSLDVAQPQDGFLDARSFGTDPAAVARHGDAWVRGARNAGALTTIRHFPGEGGRRPAADELIAVVETDRATLDRRDLVPFGALVRSGTDAVMLAPVAIPAFTGDRTTPATLDRGLGTTLLRGTLGFSGIIVSAPLTARFLRSVPALSPGEAAVGAVLAGADVLLAPADPAGAHRAVVAAVRAGRIPYVQIEESVRRILLAKARVGLPDARMVPLDSVAAVIASPEHDDIALRLAGEAITLVRDSLSIVPLDPRSINRLAVIAISNGDDVRAGERLAAELRATYGAGVSLHRLTPLTADSVADAAVTQGGRAQAVVLALFTPFDAPAQRAQLSALARRTSTRMRRVNPRIVLAAFGDPMVGADAAPAGTYILAWQPHGEHAQTALARALSGRAPITGRLPAGTLASPASAALERPALDFTLRPASPAEVGMDSAALVHVDEIVSRALANGAAPGAAVAIGRHGRLVRLRGYGRLDLRGGYDAVSDSTLYDLASLTKVVGTTTALAIVVDRGMVDLDAPVKRYIREWKGTPQKEAVTVRNLMLHNAGLEAYAPLYRTLRGREEYRRRIAAMTLSYAPGTRTVYSDFGVILVGFIIEQVTGQTLDSFLEREVFGPLGMRDTGFNPLRWPYGTMPLQDQSGPGAPAWLLQRIAPTEMDTIFRFTHVHGLVHDENAFALGGVAGHAGLFSSARDLAIFAQLLLDDGFYGGRRYFDPATVRSFTRRHADASSRAIGWDTPSEGSSAGDYFSMSSFGHTGFTGTSIWVDPERDLFVVLLTNRVNFGRENQRQVPLRRAVADAVQLAIRDMPVRPRGGELNATPAGGQ